MQSKDLFVRKIQKNKKQILTLHGCSNVLYFRPLCKCIKYNSVCGSVYCIIRMKHRFFGVLPDHRDEYLKAPNEWRKDIYFVIKCIRYNSSCFSLIEERWKNERKFIDKILEIDPSLLISMDSLWKYDKDLVYKVLKRDPSLIIQMEEVQTDPNWFKELYYKIPSIVAQGNIILDDERFFLYNLHKEPSLILHISERLKNKPSFIFKSIKKNVNVHLYGSDKFFSNIKIFIYIFNIIGTSPFWIKNPENLYKFSMISYIKIVKFVLKCPHMIKYTFRYLITGDIMKRLFKDRKINILLDISTRDTMFAEYDHRSVHKVSLEKIL